MVRSKSLLMLLRCGRSGQLGAAVLVMPLTVARGTELPVPSRRTTRHHGSGDRTVTLPADPGLSGRPAADSDGGATGYGG